MVANWTLSKLNTVDSREGIFVIDSATMLLTLLKWFAYDPKLILKLRLRLIKYV